MSKEITFNATFDYKLIYIFRINDKNHHGCLKIGDATIHTDKLYDELDDNCHELNYAARKRIDDYTSTAGVVYELLHTEIAVYKNENKNSNKYGKVLAFRDHDVHEVLKRSGIKNKYFDTNKKQNEWYITDLETAKKAIKCVKEGKTALDNCEITYENNPIVFRPEQKEAIKKTIDRFKNNNKMLWNAKMRFGKTLSALEVVKERKFEKTIIITHRPVVDEGWYEDFNKIFYDLKDEYEYGSKNNGKSIEELIHSSKHYVYFASMQDLRGSKVIGGKYNKDHEIFENDWDFVIIDEAHEGTQTDLGQKVLEKIINKGGKTTFVLNLSGTPFNLLTNFENESIYTWDYIMEQEAKMSWDQFHFGDSNPYAELPKMNIFTYHLEKSLPVYIDVEDKAFNFKEFFRIWTGDKKKDGKELPLNVKKGDFVHEKDIHAFLDLICKKDENTNYPYSTEEYRDYFRHSLWCVPGVAEAKALSKLLKNHQVFGNFEIINVAGEGDEEIDTTDALKAVKNAMTTKPEETYTITLSCGRLTTGVSIPEWTAVLMLAGSYSTQASQYLQTIFRVQTPANINGRLKEECYVFDFAPDRTLKMVAESVQLSARAGANNPVAEITLAKFLNYCPVISIEQSNMKEYKVSELLQELKKAYAERVARNGFDDPKIYNDELLKLSEIELKEFEQLKKIIGDSKQTKKTGDIDINKEGFTQEELEKEKKLEEKKKKHELSEEEKKELEKIKQMKKNRDSAISILRAISIRMPLLVYGMDIDIDVDITIDNFADNIDDLSWTEFMPKGVDKKTFKKFSKYYDKDIFVAASRRIRYIAKTADELEPTERVKKIASLFATFKNPDKETVLTPWRVVNMHMGDTVGGYNFYDENYNDVIPEPRYVNYEETTEFVFNDDSKILEINSKTGLYPLYVTYSLYRKKIKEKDYKFDEKIKIWDKVISNQIFVICKTKMAKQITKRTLIGYRKGKVNSHAFDDLVMQLKEKTGKIVEKVNSNDFWNYNGGKMMNFNAVVGNPPYQEQDSGKNEASNVARTSAISVYQHFVETSKKITNKYVSLIIPTRWMTGGKGLDTFREKNINDKHYMILHDFENDREVFPNTDIGGGIMYYLWNKDYEGKVNYFSHNGDDVSSVMRDLNTGDSIVIRDYNSAQIIKKINSSESFMSLVSARKPFGLGADVTRKMPELFSDNYSKEKPIKFYCWDGVPCVKYLKNNTIKDTKLLNSYKVFISKTGDPYMRLGRINKGVLRKPFIGEKMSACSETYLSIGSFSSEYEPQAISKYILTKFFRFLVLQKKKTQNVSRDVFEFVPIQDFTKKSDVNWSASVKEIDKQLYKKYKLSKEEIEYIEQKIDYLVDNE